MGGCTLCMPSQIDAGLKAVRGCVWRLFFACLAWLGLSGQRGAVLRRPGLGRQVGGHALGVTPLRCSRQGGAFELAARPAGAPLKQLRPVRYASALTRAHLAAALLGAHKAPEPRPASTLVPRFVRAGGAMCESVTRLEWSGRRSIHDTTRAPTSTRQSFPDTIRVISDKRRAPAPAHAPPRCIRRAPSSANAPRWGVSGCWSSAFV